ncbi:MAG: PAS domain S-box protein [Betaproteobacteria bacterium]|nr:PAS domain S-box protein [Betaproteobacteria bacterium]
MNGPASVHIAQPDSASANPKIQTPSKIWVAALLLIAACGILVGAYLVFEYQKQQIKRQSENNLATIAALKATLIASWVGDRKADGVLLGDHTLLANTMDQWLRAGARNEESRQWLLARLNAALAAQRYQALMLLDPQGRVRLSTQEAGEKSGVDEQVRRLAAEAMRSQQVIFGDIHIGATQQPELSMVAPLLVGKGENIRAAGALYFRIDPTSFLFPMIQSWPVESVTAETLLVRRDGNEVLYLNEPRHFQGKALSLREPLDSPDLPEARAVRGETGFAVGVDYRGQQVVAYLLHVPETRWSMVAKIDEAEIYAPILRLGIYIVLTVIAVVLLAVFIFWSLQQRAAYVAEHYRRELENRQLSQRFDYLRQFANDIILLVDDRGDIVEANDRAVEAYGFSKDELLQMNIKDFRTGGSVINLERDWRLLREKGNVVYETIHQRKNGDTFPVEISARRIELDGQEYFQSILRDITERKNAAEALRESEERYALIFETAPDAMLVVDSSGCIERANTQTERMFGYRREEMLGQRVEMLIPGGAQERYRDLRKEPAGDPAQRQKGESRVLMASGQAGRTFPVEINVSPIRMGGALHLIVAVVDVSEQLEMRLALEQHQQQLEEQVAARTADLEAAEARTRLILESSADGLYGIDTQGKIVFANLAACNLLGYTQEQMIGRVAKDLLHNPGTGGGAEPAARPTGKVVLWEDSGGVRLDDERIWRADGTSLNVEYESMPMRRQGEVVGEVVSFRDISARRTAEIASRDMLAEAERLAQARGDFLANMSHEIRTPLNAVLGLAQVGLRSGKNRETFERILSSGQLLLAVVNDILDFSKIEAGKMTLEWIRFRVDEVIDRAVDLNALRAYTKGLDFRVEEDADLPPVLIGDPMRLSQVLVNLLSNAVKFTEHGHITLSVKGVSGAVVFQVADSGIGMSAEQVSRLFQAFDQADGSTTRRFGGTGLGLVICQRLVELMGGEILVHSQAGAGSTFEVRLPLFAAPVQTTAASVAGMQMRLAGLPPEETRGLTAALMERGIAVAEVSPGRIFELSAIKTNTNMLVVDCAALCEIPDLPRLAKLLERGQKMLVICTPGGAYNIPEEVREHCAFLERPVRARQLVAAEARVLRPEENQAVVAGPRLTGIRILAAEDNEVNRLVLGEILAMEGASLICTDDGLQAYERLQEAGAYAFDIVLTDIQMPRMDGYETARCIHAIAPDLPVIGLTAHAMAEERDRCLAAGMADHVAKPIDVDVLVAAILRQVRGASSGAVDIPAPEETPVAGEYLSADQPDSGVPGMEIDWAGLEVRFKGKQAFIDKLAATTLASHRDTPAKLRAAAAAREMEALAFAAHSLKGMSGNLMAWPLHELAKRTEEAARQGAPETIEQAVQLAETLERLLAALTARTRDTRHKALEEQVARTLIQEE